MREPSQTVKSNLNLVRIPLEKSMNQDILEINVSPAERAAATMLDSNMDAAIKALREDGICVLANVVSNTSTDALLKQSLLDVQHLVNRPDAPFNWVKGNVQQDPPPFPPYLFRDILVNDLVISVTKSILGAGLRCGFYSGNTAMPSESRQPVHADEGQLWPHLEAVPPGHAYVVNVPLVDVSPENGSTEMWRGTHLDPTIAIQSGDIVIPTDRLEARRQVRPPIQPVVKAGSVVIRDIRMWHAGMPNHTQKPRPMIAMIHAIAWWPTSKIRFARGSEPYLEHPDLKWNVEYVDGEIDHLSGVHGFMAGGAA
jgi:hypothetical protein